MSTHGHDLGRGLDALRAALAEVLGDVLDPAPTPAGPLPAGWLAAESVRLDGDTHRATGTSGTSGGATGGAGSPSRSRSHADDGPPTSSEEDEADARRMIALVELARAGDTEAFGQLYDRYHLAVYRFVYYRVGSVALAEDLASETFFRALRSMSSFRWQGRDFGAWLMTIARNLTTDHYKAGRTRLERTTEDMSLHDAATEGPEPAVLASLTNEALLGALRELPHEQQECLIMRFLQGLSIAETAAVLGRSDGAVKQLQLRGVRALAKLLPEGVR
jgi:RNA polymerase sigma-70 factor (ECF subfamily)